MTNYDEEFELWKEASKASGMSEEEIQQHEKNYEDWKEWVIRQEEEYYKLQQLEIAITSEEIQQFKDEAKISEYIGIKQKWMQLFSLRSYYNEISGEILFHVLLGLLFKDKKIFLHDGTTSDLKVNYLNVQDSGTGKDKGLDFFFEILNHFPNVTHRQLSNAESAESLLDGFEFDTKKRQYTNTIVKGILSSNDLVYSRECNFLLNERNEKGSQKREYLLFSLENRPIPKSLVMWGNRETNTHGKNTFIGITRFIPSIKDTILYSGFMQRNLTYIRKVDSELRDKMNSKDSSINFGNEKDVIDFKEKCLELVNELKDIINVLLITPIKAIREDKLNALILKKNKEFNTQILNLENFEQKTIAYSFVSRYKKHLLPIIYHNAIIRKSQTIEEIDVINALDLIEKCFNQLILWLEEGIEEPKDAYYRRRKTETVIKEFLTARISATKYELAKYISKRLKKTVPTGYNKIKENLEGENSLLIEQEGKISLRS